MSIEQVSEQMVASLRNLTIRWYDLWRSGTMPCGRILNSITWNPSKSKWRH